MTWRWILGLQCSNELWIKQDIVQDAEIIHQVHDLQKKVSLFLQQAIDKSDSEQKNKIFWLP